MGVFLGIELGSTRIKAVATDSKGKTLSAGAHDWENRFEDGVWTYHLDDVWQGLQESVKDLFENYAKENKEPMPVICGIGISAMMHGYLVFDASGGLLTPFRTWRNTMTEQSSGYLSELFSFNIPQRWSIAHLHQAMTNKEPHVSEIDFLTTLGGYVHYKLTGKRVAGIGEASGIFPIDSSKNDYNDEMVSKFDALASRANMPWKLRDILPEALDAGEDAGCLTEEGARLLDPAGAFADILKPGISLCPPEGDAGTGMVATNAITPGTGNVSAGTSIFAMLVLEKELKNPHPQIDIVTTPAGKPVAMVHGANCTADLDAWAGLFGEIINLFPGAAGISKTELYRTLYNSALGGEADCGGLVSVNYLSGEHITGFSEGRPLMLRTPDSKMTASNLMRSLLFSAMTTLRIGVDILAKEEGVEIKRLIGHGGLFKTPVVAQRLMAGALNIPLAVMDSAAEGGAWGIALLAAYRVLKIQGESLEDFLEKNIFADAKVSVIEPSQEDVDGFDKYLERFKKALEVEKTAVEVM